MTTPPPKRKTTSITLSTDLLEKLQVMAKAAKRSLSRQIEFLIEPVVEQ